MTPRALLALAIPALMILLTSAGVRAAYAQAPDPCLISFDLDRADTLGAVGVQSSLATDAAGRPHIAYLNASGSQVQYAHREGTRWVTEQIPQKGFYHGVSLALDAAGNAYMGYAAQEETPRGVVTSAKLARRSSGGWTIETIETAFATEVSVGLDPDGVLHAVYFSFIPGFVVRYGTRTADGWTTETVLSTLGLGAGRFSLAFDPQGHPHVTAQVNRTLLHLVRTASGWISDKQPPGEGVSLAVDTQGVPHVASHIRTPPVVQYRTREGAVWHVEAVDSVDAGPERGVSLKIDRFGRPVLAYVDAVAGRLKVAWKDGSVWRIQTVDAGGSGEGPSLFLAEGANPRISYLDGASFDLLLASGDLPPPNLPPVANAGGPYTGVIGERVAFDGAHSSDTGGHALAYAWDFGDGVKGTGRSPEHAYAAAGTYHVCLTVTDDGCPVLADQSCTAANVQDALAARVFRRQGGKINLGADDDQRHCFQLEPIAGSFKLADLNLSTLVARFDTTQVLATPGKVMIAADTDHNGVEEVRVCFSAAALRTLLASAPLGKSQVTIRLEGALISGARVRGETTFLIKKKDKGCDGECAEVSPNPLNPEAALTFATSRPGSVEVAMFDVRGRLLRTLLARSFLAAGTHEIRIDGRDPSGRPLPSGVYFYRIETPERTLTGRFSIIK